MAQIDSKLGLSQFKRAVRPVLGLKVSRPWLGYGDVLFLDIGAITTESLELRGSPPSRVRKGQVTIMIGSAWRAETSDAFQFAIQTPRRQLKRQVPRLAGRTVTEIAIQGFLPELTVELDHQLHIRSFCINGPPDWTIFLRDQALFPRDKRWNVYDHSLSVGTSSKGQLISTMCYGLRSGTTTV